MSMARALAAVAAAVLAAGCSNATVSASPITIDATPLVLDFGNQTAGTRTTKSFTVSNEGLTALSISSIAISNDFRSAFSLGATPQQLSAGSSAVIEVIYTAPATPGTDGASVIIASDASNTPQLWNLTLRRPRRRLHPGERRRLLHQPGRRLRRRHRGRQLRRRAHRRQLRELHASPSSAAASASTTSAPRRSSPSTVTLAGSGSGAVISSPAGIDCNATPGALCAANFSSGDTVSLVASADANSTFTGFSGDCSGLTCTLTIGAAANVTATFAPAHTITVSVAGLGSVGSSPSGIAACTSAGGSNCAALFTDGAPVTLTATPTSGNIFTGWSGGGCSGTSTCTITLAGANATTTATFTPQHLILVTVSGSGSVSSSPSGITACTSAGGVSCAGAFTDGTPVTLTATPSSGSIFSGWSGSGCSGTSTCTITLPSGANASATATFTAQHTLAVAVAGSTARSARARRNHGLRRGGWNQLRRHLHRWNSSHAHRHSRRRKHLLRLERRRLRRNLDLHHHAGGLQLRDHRHLYRSTHPHGDGGRRRRGQLQPGWSHELYSLGWKQLHRDLQRWSPNHAPAPLRAAAASSRVGPAAPASGTSSCTVTLSGANAATTATFTAQHTLTVTVAGNGSVSSNPSGITNCTAAGGTSYSIGTFNDGVPVTLTATPGSGSVFTGWSNGGCTGTSTCTVTLSGASVATTATFTAQHTLTVTVAGNGSVSSSPGWNHCMHLFRWNQLHRDLQRSGVPVTLTATPGSSAIFSGWTSGACTGTAACTVTLSGTNAATTATFTTQHTITVTVTGHGSVGSSPSGISGCTAAGGNSCVGTFNDGVPVTLTATNGSGSVFSGWSGSGCSENLDLYNHALGSQRCRHRGLHSSTHHYSDCCRNGSVSSSPSGITGCTSSGGSNCSGTFTDGVQVTLTATTSNASTFSGWSGGGCSGTSTCSITLSGANASTTATFATATNTLTVTVSGSEFCLVEPGRHHLLHQLGWDLYKHVQQWSRHHTHGDSLERARNLSGWSGGSGACSGSSTCVVVLEGNNASTTATFLQLAQVTPTGTAPAARYSHRSVMDTTNNRIIMFGGGANQWNCAADAE